MQYLAIVVLTLVAAIGYGLIHDQITVRVCLEYFAVTHPPLFGSSSPTVIAFGWGLLTTWTAGIPAGFLLASAATNGTKYPRVGVREVFPIIGQLVISMAVAATAAGFVGSALTTTGLVAVPEQYAWAIEPGSHSRFIAVWWAHSASYVVGIIGLIVGAMLLYSKRRAMGRLPRISVRTVGSEKTTRQ